jgi:phosphoglycolate phosphatase
MVISTLDRVTSVLFDLDGTLVDSAPGITQCLSETIRAFGGPAVTPASLVPFVGPPVVDTIRSFTDLPSSRLHEAVEHYRARYLERGIVQSAVFPGIPALLGMLQELRIPIAVATSKRSTHARAILRHHRLDGAFAAVCGAAEDDSAADKPTVIRAALSDLGAAGEHPVMVGDRSYDIRGAVALDIPAIFARWGYGAASEAEGALLAAANPSELGAALQPHLRPALHTQGVQ